MHICDIHGNFIVVDCPDKSFCGIRDGVLGCLKRGEEDDLIIFNEDRSNFPNIEEFLKSKANKHNENLGDLRKQDTDNSLLRRLNATRGSEDNSCTQSEKEKGDIHKQNDSEEEESPRGNFSENRDRGKDLKKDLEAVLQNSNRIVPRNFTKLTESLRDKNAIHDISDLKKMNKNDEIVKHRSVGAKILNYNGDSNEVLNDKIFEKNAKNVETVTVTKILRPASDSKEKEQKTISPSSDNNKHESIKSDDNDNVDSNHGKNIKNDLENKKIFRITAIMMIKKIFRMIIMTRSKILV
ncbi:hypothetical protein EDEG_02925 [Edhazardia aedis USNM 41457]|uniref:Uncharacterized protein n=1 Tax=Edhazardia aedis (strain USNM 41457) TaxID=1003232 RepID=J8ZSQ6_EDHAE|nr:hypothetical protein EDEG_02925 [Edhazardia aedis USNM 41457]|eukprot:EJW02693.1 hypothetical protein EDEG_02925 [Edhazardia aedis USNM 41457]